MTITIAGEKKEYAEGTTIAQIIEAEKVENPLYVTVSLNDDFVDKDTFDTTTVKEGDSIEFLYFFGIFNAVFCHESNHFTAGHLRIGTFCNQLIT